MSKVTCITCNTEFNVVPARVPTAKFCSYKCAGEYRKTAYLGENNHRWKGGERTKTCPHCGQEFNWAGEPYANWVKRKFCSKACADKGGFRYTGETNWKWNPDPNKKRHRGNQHYKWADAVFTRDANTCRECGATGIELHAHHIKPYKDFPELRYEVSSGVTLCFECHWDVHSAQNEKAVNSVEPLTVIVSRKGNTEPSLQGNLLEGVTTRGRAYRRVLSACKWCGKPVSKKLSDVSKSGNIFCSKVCSGKHIASIRTYRPMKNAAKAVTSSTSPAPERDDIV